jgi:hypothetical protein
MWWWCKFLVSSESSLSFFSFSLLGSSLNGLLDWTASVLFWAALPFRGILRRTLVWKERDILDIYNRKHKFGFCFWKKIVMVPEARQSQRFVVGIVCDLSFFDAIMLDTTRGFVCLCITV